MPSDINRDIEGQSNNNISQGPVTSGFMDPSRFISNEAAQLVNNKYQKWLKQLKMH